MLNGLSRACLVKMCSLSMLNEIEFYRINTLRTPGDYTIELACPKRDRN